MPRVAQIEKQLLTRVEAVLKPYQNFPDNRAVERSISVELRASIEEMKLSSQVELTFVRKKLFIRVGAQVYSFRR